MLKTFMFTTQERTVILFLVVALVVGGIIYVYKLRKPSFAPELKVIKNESSVEVSDSVGERLQKTIKETKEMLFDIQKGKPHKKININTASREDLMLLPGIGPTYADRIIEYRNKKHTFRDITEIMKIKGIGEKIFDQLKDKITVE